MEAGAEPDEADQLSLADAPALPALVEGDGDGGGRRVPVLLDVVVDAVVAQPERLLHRLVAPQVRLVRDEQLDAGRRHVGPGAEFSDRLRHPRLRDLEYGAAVHLRFMLLLAV